MPRSPHPVLLALLLVGCYGARDHVRILDALHEPDGSVRFRAAVETPQEAFWRELLGQLPGDLNVAEPEVVQVDDPYELTLEHLIGLSLEDPQDPENQILQVSSFAWYGVHDPYVLARERAFRGLGRSAGGLGVERLENEPEEPATPAEVVGDVRAIVAALGIAKRNELGWSEALADACDRLRERPLDLEGGKHTARVLGRLLDSVGPREVAGWAPFWKLSDRVLARLTAQALGLGVSDLEPRVRAAAMLAALRITDGYGESLAGLLGRDSAEETRVAGLRWLAEHGFPRGSETDSSEGQAAFEAEWVRLVVVRLQEAFEGPVAVWACRALETLTDAPLSTLRTEEWLAWYYDEGGQAAVPRPAAAGAKTAPRD